MMNITGTLTAVGKNVYWPYNKTFERFHDVPLAGKRAQQFIDKLNVCKGGQWVLVTPEVYQEWFDSVGKLKEELSRL